jgi:hypothetical protein
MGHLEGRGADGKEEKSMVKAIRTRRLRLRG